MYEREKENRKENVEERKKEMLNAKDLLFHFCVTECNANVPAYILIAGIFDKLLEKTVMEI